MNDIIIRNSEFFYWSVDYTISRRCVSLGLNPSASKAWENLVTKWISCSGAEWTIKRIKSLKIDVIRHTVGLPPLTWIKRNRIGNPYGVLGYFFSYANKGKRNFATILNSLACVTAIKSSVRPLRPVILADMVRNLEMVAMKQSFEPLLVPYRCADLLEEEFRPMFFWEGSPSAKSPSPSLSYKSKPQNSIDFDEFCLFTGKSGAVIESWAPNIFQTLFKGIRIPKISFKMGGHIDEPIGGHLVPLNKDGSGKIRWIASPFRSFQEALRPLGKALFHLLRKSSWDCTFDQAKGIRKIQAAMGSGKGNDFYSFDLSSATDRFPLDLQMHVLRRLNNSPLWNESINLFEQVSRSKFYYDGSYYSWKVGQPMGLYPSFASFALTHGILLYNLANFKSPFVVLGDDVVIWDRTLAENYIKFLGRYEVPISYNKTFISPSLAEFAGAVITPSGVYRSFKWKDYDDNNFLELMKTFGMRFLRELTPRQARVYKLVASFQLPFGCNHNVTDVAQSVADTPTFERSPGKPCLDFSEYAQNKEIFLTAVSIPFLRELTETFDEKVKKDCLHAGWAPFSQGKQAALKTVVGNSPHGGSYHLHKPVPKRTLLKNLETFIMKNPGIFRNKRGEDS